MNGSKSHGGVRWSIETELSSSSSSKRRKFDNREHDNVAELENQCRSEINVNSQHDIVSSPESGSICDHIVSLSPRCLKNELSLDLTAEQRFETETTICSNVDCFSREETSASSEICADSNEMDSTSPLKMKQVAATSCQIPIKETRIPWTAEIDEFFAQAEKKEQKRFTDKYNYDIVKDVPMEGRYQWVRLNQ